MDFGVIIFITITLMVLFFVIAHSATKNSEASRQENIDRMSSVGFTKTKAFHASSSTKSIKMGRGLEWKTAALYS